MATVREIQGPLIRRHSSDLTRSTWASTLHCRASTPAYIRDLVSETLRAPSHSRMHRNAKDRSR
jgi:hypothetical protein